MRLLKRSELLHGLLPINSPTSPLWSHHHCRQLQCPWPSRAFDYTWCLVLGAWTWPKKNQLFLSRSPKHWGSHKTPLLMEACPAHCSSPWRAPPSSPTWPGLPPPPRASDHLITQTSSQTSNLHKHQAQSQWEENLASKKSDCPGFLEYT